jgi:hypothetical protein
VTPSEDVTDNLAHDGPLKLENRVFAGDAPAEKEGDFEIRVTVECAGRRYGHVGRYRVAGLPLFLLRTECAARTVGTETWQTCSSPRAGDLLGFFRGDRFRIAAEYQTAVLQQGLRGISGETLDLKLAYNGKPGPTEPPLHKQQSAFRTEPRHFAESGELAIGATLVGVGQVRSARQTAGAALDDVPVKAVENIVLPDIGRHPAYWPEVVVVATLLLAGLRGGTSVYRWSNARDKAIYGGPKTLNIDRAVPASIFARAMETPKIQIGLDANGQPEIGRGVVQPFGQLVLGFLGTVSVHATREGVTIDGAPVSPGRTQIIPEGGTLQLDGGPPLNYRNFA